MYFCSLQDGNILGPKSTEVRCAGAIVGGVVGGVGAIALATISYFLGKRLSAAWKKRVRPTLHLHHLAMIVYVKIVTNSKPRLHLFWLSNKGFALIAQESPTQCNEHSVSKHHEKIADN